MIKEVATADPEEIPALSDRAAQIALIILSEPSQGRRTNVELVARSGLPSSAVSRVLWGELWSPAYLEKELAELHVNARSALEVAVARATTTP